MSKKTAKKQTTKEEDEYLTFLRISERGKTIRWCVAWVCVVAIVGIIGWVIVRVTDKPMWEGIVSAICGSVTLIVAGQFGLFRYLQKRIQRYTSLNQERVAEMERERDPNRSSSGLMKDGTNPPEDRI